MGRLTPNGYGLYDMAGNVAEWCQDWLSSYSTVPQTNPVGPAMGSHRVIRGGTWGGSADYCRISCRSSTLPGECSCFTGFRVCLDL
ncbi:formylglycine-generating enzyme family protein [Anaerohalosphaeraceae bacterium U12dextr]